ncbi:hypothetical protein RI129_012849, partial [Pyrocoelia pectoralis]
MGKHDDNQFPILEVDENNKLPVAWQLWKRSFQVYMLDVEDALDNDAKKVARFIRKIGPTGAKIFWTLFPDVDPETLGTVKLTDVYKKFDEHCVPLKNIPMETHIFHSIKQKEEQTIMEFVTELRKQAADCEFVCKGCKVSY